ncbi:unnamed protein product [Meloidogyne enterolobii]|uniref:Uncharacterized protein n=1 Tax=Meloidogyne enterolobii TaxID=390850 RepID=A0ACB0ZAP5_MELEN
MPILSSSSSSSKTRKYSEQSLANFNRAQFFFNPSHIQPQTDRRCLQRLHIENSFAKLNTCGEDKLPAFFKEFYDELLHFEIDPAHSYQLIINSLTYFYSKITWATSVQKCVFEFICEFLGEFHSHLDKKRLIELELVCLLELFMLRYEYKNGNENNIFNILVQIRKTSKGADCHLSGFVNNVIINHFGYTLEPLLRNICDRLNLQVKLYRSSDSLQNISTKRKSSMTSSNQESHTSSIEPTFSEDEELNEGENSEDEISKSIEKKRSKSHDKINKLANKKLKTTDKLKIRKKASRGRRRY